MKGQSVSSSPKQQQRMVDRRGPFVGYEPEFDGLTDDLQRVLLGQGQLVLISGDPGLGKTRFAQEIASVARDSGLEVHWGFSREGEGSPPYWPWVQILQSYVANCDPARLRAELGSGTAIVGRLVPEIRDALPDSEFIDPSPESDDDQFVLFEALTTFLRNASDNRPLVLILDDVHWADRSSLLLLSHVARSLGERRIAVVATYSELDLTPSSPLMNTLGQLGRVSSAPTRRVRLSGFSAEDTSRYIESVIGTPPTTEVVRSIHSRTGGNPLFLAELVERLSAPPIGAAPSLDSEIPDSIRGLIGRRLERLSEQCSLVLTTASTIGGRFSLRQLRAAHHEMSEEDIFDLLEEATRERVIADAEGSAVEFEFTQKLTQEMLAGSLSSARRARIHARIAANLEDSYGAEADNHAVELAHHFAEAAPILGDAKAVRYAVLAADQARAVFAYTEAVDYYRMALTAREHSAPTGRGSDPDHESAAILMRLGGLLSVQLGASRSQEGLDALAQARLLLRPG